MVSNEFAICEGILYLLICIGSVPHGVAISEMAGCMKCNFLVNGLIEQACNGYSTLKQTKKALKISTWETLSIVLVLNGKEWKSCQPKMRI